MKRQRFWKAGQAASALPLALALALLPPAASAQDRKIVPFLTAESSPEAVKQILDLIAQFEEQNPDIGIELQLMSNDIRAARIINSVSVGDELGIFEIERRLVPDFTQAGYLLPLDSIVENIGERQVHPRLAAVLAVRRASLPVHLRPLGRHAVLAQGPVRGGRPCRAGQL